jgi:hypothetical protein
MIRLDNENLVNWVKNGYPNVMTVKSGTAGGQWIVYQE